MSATWTKKDKLGGLGAIAIFAILGISDYCSRGSRLSSDEYRREQEITKGMKAFDPNHQLTDDEKRVIRRTAVEAEKLDHNK